MNIKNKGFTLVELLAVIIVLGIIMVIVIPKIGDAYNASRKKIAYENAQRLVKSFDEYYVRKKIRSNDIECEYDFTNDLNECSDFSFDGEKPISGYLELSDSGSINGNVVFNKYSFSVVNGNVTFSEE